jgi:hypothetical protein
MWPLAVLWNVDCVSKEHVSMLVLKIILNKELGDSVWKNIYLSMYKASCSSAKKPTYHNFKTKNISTSIKRRFQWLISSHKIQNDSNPKIITFKTWHYFIETVMRYNNHTYIFKLQSCLFKISFKIRTCLTLGRNSKHHESLQWSFEVSCRNPPLNGGG